MRSSFLQLNQEKTEIIPFGNKMEIIQVAAQFESRELKSLKTSRVRDLMSRADLEELIPPSSPDYCNALRSGLPNKTIRHLQLIQNATAKDLTRTRKTEQITAVLRSSHWLPAE